MAEMSVITSWPTECPFNEVGCSEMLFNYQEYSKHLAKNIEQHLQMVVGLHKDTEIISPVEKLSGIRSEIEYLEGTLASLGVGQLPAVECIKTQLREPGVTINSLGDKCAFRMNNITRLSESNTKWYSPYFSLRKKYLLRIVVYPTGTGLGTGTHLSVFLVAKFGENFEWPIKLPKHLGLKVELLVETDHSDSDSDSDANDFVPNTYGFTWRPKLSIGSPNIRYPNHQGIKSTTEESPKTKPPPAERELRKRLSKILPPWCQPPPTDSGPSSPAPNSPGPSDVADGSLRSEEAPRQRRHRRKSSHGADEFKTGPDGVILYSSEKFATLVYIDDIIREFNSLVFQISICLKQTLKVDVSDV